jgi:transposase InsO family protein
VVSVEELRLQVLLEAERSDESIAELCRRRGIARSSFYEWSARYRAEGIAGLEPRSRRPARSPGRIEAELEATICRLRKDHPRWGARRIRAELRRAGLEPPAASTIHRALKRNHLVAPQPPRRRKARKRFEREVANDLWQIDGTQLKLSGGERVWVVDVLDDHTRFLLAAFACEALDGKAAWACFVAAGAAYGLPRQLLSDNGSYFTGRLLGFVADFERKLGEVGVELICAAPAHPQTLGKLERFHRTLKEWLQDEGPPADVEHLQLLLDRFRQHYNEERPHQGIGDQTPAERWRGADAASAPGKPPTPLAELALTEQRKPQPAYPPAAVTRKVWTNGVTNYDGVGIILGRRFAGATVRIVEIGELIHVYHGEELVRVLAPDRARRYQRVDKHKARRRPPETR